MKRALMHLSSLPSRLRGRHRRVVVEDVHGVPIVVLPRVFNPVLFRSGELLAGVLRDELLGRPAATVLDLGAGSGVGSVFSARLGAQVVAVDVNPRALRNVRANAELHGVADHVRCVQGDLFDGVAGERFDRVLFNPPYFEGEPSGIADAAWRGEGIVARFCESLGDHLTPGGAALLATSGEGIGPAMLDRLRDQGYRVDELARRQTWLETLFVHRARIAEC